MTLDVDEFIRRFLIHVLPDGFHRIRHYGLFANANPPLVTQPSSCPEPTNQIKQRRQIPHRSTPASVRTPPAVSSLEAFPTPASVHPLCPVTGRRPKTLNFADVYNSFRRQDGHQ